MKVVICVNHSWAHVGGCEKIVAQIGEGLSNKFNHDCTVYSYSYNQEPQKHNNVFYKGTGKSSQKFLKNLLNEKPDHILVYSDMFVYWPNILNHLANIKCGKTIVLVGMNAMRQNGVLLQKLIKNQNLINVVVHSKKYIDYLMCQHYKIPVTVIPNGIDFSEFENCSVDFRTKHNISPNTKIILCVSNFFPGKGQEFLVPIIKKVQNEVKDCIAIFISSPVNFPFAKILQNKFIGLAKESKINFKLLSGENREEVVSAFLAANVFAFPSQKEVAPLVILEAMASGTPWVSLPVGNANELKGGVVIKSDKKDMDENFIYDESITAGFSKALVNILENIDHREHLILEGRKAAQCDSRFDIIINKYNELIKKGTHNE